MSALKPARMPLMHPVLEYLRDNPNSSSEAIAVAICADHRDVQRWICELALRNAIVQTGAEARGRGRRPAPLYAIAGYDPDHRALFRKIIGDAEYAKVEKTLFDRAVRLINVSAMSLRMVNDPDAPGCDGNLATALEHTAAELDECNQTYLQKKGVLQ